MATEPDLPVSFEHVPVRYRHDGWTPQKQFAFLEKLADCGSITIAARHVGMSREAVRKLRRHPRG
jgi:molybdenum-dependent DNA-binding transcriptional regulator ModE